LDLLFWATSIKAQIMRTNLLLFFFLSFFATQLSAQKVPLSYYLPEIAYDPKVPSPEAFLGYQIGEWHISHDQLIAYMRKLAETSPRVKLTEFGRTYEGRPLIHLTISAEKNLQNIDAIKAQHVALTNPNESGKANLSNMPLVIYQGFSIHGNEPSGGNAAPLVAYYLAAGNSPEIDKLLNDVVIIFDPSFNPDGFQRFSTWVNQHKNKNLIGDPQDREYNEVWPGGRFNHYWFDLNRDWLSGAHPESRGRAKLFHEWKPNILTDHHEMGTNSSFFFMPGVPSRVNPITPLRNQDLTAKIGQFHAKNLDKIGSLYYSQEGYDDFYYGKGSTFPDVNGCIGILFEQASSRGHLQETPNGPLPFHFTIRNQVQTAFSTHQAAVELRQELLEFQRTFFQDAYKEAKADARAGFVFGDTYDPARLDQMVEILRRHQIDVHALGAKVTVEGKTFEPGSSYVVPLEQAQYRLVRGIFESSTTFQDSIFYDISAWGLPLAFNLPYAALQRKGLDSKVFGAKIEGARPEHPATVLPTQSSYAYLLEWDNYYAPKALHYLQSKGVRSKVAMESLTLNGKTYSPGTIMITAQNQSANATQIFQWITEAAKSNNVVIDAVSTGLTPVGIDLGSVGFANLRQPKVMILVGEGVSPGTAGEAWHLLDQRFDVPVSKVEADDLGRFNLSRYNVIVMGDGAFNTIPNAGVAKLKEWVNGGGTLIAMQRAITWLKGQGIGYVEVRENKDNKEKDKPKPRRPYGQWDEDFGALEIPGTIFEAELDLTHPLCFGLHRNRMPVFRDSDLFLEPAKNPYATPVLYTAAPLLSGYVNGKLAGLAPNSAGVVVSSSGGGKVIFMADNPNFRAHWWGTNRLFLNAVFFGNVVNGATTEVEGKKE